MHIDPKAPASSPQHPANWRKPVFSSTPSYTMDATSPDSVPEPPAAVATPVVEPTKKTPRKAARRKASDLASALAALGDG